LTLVAHGVRTTVGRGATERVLFSELSFRCEPGTLTAVVGPNGAGKTTLLRCLAGLRTCQGGGITCAGQPIAILAPRERARRIAYLPQRALAPDAAVVADVVMLGRTPHLGRFRSPSADDHRQVRRALDRVRMQGFVERRLDTLSGGERQRVMIARMLASEATALILDEPTLSLDIGHALQVLELCRELAHGEGRIVIMALHELGHARRYADRAVCLDGKGRVMTGVCSEVLDCATLSEVFGVQVREGAEPAFFLR
jgi:iron complex transport system ATP-binding protein